MFFLVRSLCLGDLEVIYLTATDAERSCKEEDTALRGFPPLKQVSVGFPPGKLREYTEVIGQGQWKAMYAAIDLQQLFTAVTVGVILGKLNIGLYKYYLCFLSINSLTTVDYKFMNIPNSRLQAEIQADRNAHKAGDYLTLEQHIAKRSRET